MNDVRGFGAFGTTIRIVSGRFGGREATWMILKFQFGCQTASSEVLVSPPRSREIDTLTEDPSKRGSRLVHLKFGMRILLTNDDGPPSPESPFVAPFIDKLSKLPNVHLQVVLPASNKSWIGKAFHIKETVEASSYEHTTKDGEKQTWTLLETTPAACTQIGLAHFTDGAPFDYVISGPNFGRNSSNVMCCSSGTLGAALEASMLNVCGISISFAFYSREEAFDQKVVDRAVKLAIEIVQRLVKVQGCTLWNVNVPLVAEPKPVLLTTMDKNAYFSLFQPVESPFESTMDAVGLNRPTSFKWAPLLKTQKPPEEGTDSWVLNLQCASVTPLTGNFESPIHFVSQLGVCQDVQHIPMDIFDDLNGEIHREATTFGPSDLVMGNVFTSRKL